MSRVSWLRELLKKETLTEQLLRYTDDYEIYCTLVGHDIELGEAISSPIRSSDEFPSFALYVPDRLIALGFDIRPEEIWFKDLADGRYGNVFKFVRYYAAHHHGIDLQTRYEVIQFIDNELELGLLKGEGSKQSKVLARSFPKVRKASNLYVKSRKYTRRDLQYWGRLEQTAEDLKFWDVRSIRYLLDEKGKVRKEFRRNELAYLYKFYDKEKLYQPEAPRSFKFRNTCPGDDYRYYQGYQQLRGKSNGVNKLIITKSYKDVMVFYKFFNEYLNIPVDVIAPHAESINLSEKFIHGIKQNYDDIYCVSDYDLAGVKFANQCKRYGLHYRFVCTNRILINGRYKVLDKDISDYLWNHGKEETIQLLKSWKI